MLGDCWRIVLEYSEKEERDHLSSCCEEAAKINDNTDCYYQVYVDIRKLNYFAKDTLGDEMYTELMLMQDKIKEMKKRGTWETRSIDWYKNSDEFFMDNDEDTKKEKYTGEYYDLNEVYVVEDLFNEVTKKYKRYKNIIATDVSDYNDLYVIKDYKNIKGFVTDEDFNVYIDDMPDRIKLIKLGTCFEQEIKRFPQHLEFLEMEDNNDSNGFNNLPDSIIHLKLGLQSGKIDKLPKSLEYFDTGFYFNQEIKWPKNLKQVVFGKNYDQSIDTLPDSVECISFEGFTAFNTKINKLPKSLERLEISGTFDHNIDCFPKYLKYLKIIGNFNSKISNLPEGLETLIFEGMFNQKIYKFPSTLIELQFGNGFNQKLENLPKNLKYLTIGNGMWYPYEVNNEFSHMWDDVSDFEQEITNIPESLEILMFSNSFYTGNLDIGGKCKVIYDNRLVGNELPKFRPVQKLVL